MTLDTAPSSNAILPPSGAKKGLVERIKEMNRLFALTVVVPTTIAVVYFGLIASDVYVSESRFVVRSPERQVSTGAVGALLQGAGLSGTANGAYSVIDYIQSRDALSELNADNYIRKAYNQHGDFFDRFPGIAADDSFEALLRYYQKDIVDPELETTSSITTLKVRAFTAKNANQINERLLELSERLVNKMNARAAADAIQFAQREADLAADKVKTAAVALAKYRNVHTVFDPDRQSALQLQQVAELQAQRFSAQSRLAQIQSVSPANPQVRSLKTAIATFQKQIDGATGGVTGKKGSLSEKAIEYQRLQLDAQFAQKQLTSALGGLELARAEAQRKQLYLERIVQPSMPDEAVEPRRLRGIFATFVLGLISWGVLTLLIAGVKEHRD